MGSDNLEMTGVGDPRLTISSPVVRGIVLRILHCKTAADSLPSIFSAIVTNGKIASMVFIGAYLIFISLWFPFWLLSFAISEWGVYLLSIGFIFFVGRSIIRMIAFPGASQKVTADIEKEFARYSVRMIVSALNGVIEVATILAGNNGSDSSQGMSNYELPGLRRRAKTYRDRVLGMYFDVLLVLYNQPSTSAGSTSPDITKYGNNRLSGDIGNLSGLTPKARADGRELLDRLRQLLRLVDELEEHAKPVLNAGQASGRPGPLSDEARTAARQLSECAGELRDFVSSLKPPPSPDDEDEEESEEDLTVDAMRKKVEEQSSTAVDAVKSAFASILPMLDPPPHTSIFGFDVQRGAMLSRYRGARQFWIRRPQGGMIDVLHFPAKDRGSGSPRNPKAVLYCNPNAGLIEVATGMSLVGGNVPSADPDNASHDNSWTDYYTELGIDVYVFNYAGYGRSFGTTLCVSGRNAGDTYSPGLLARLVRIFRSCFLTFQPTPDTLRADGLAVARHLVNDGGIEQLIIHGESIGGVAASGTACYLSRAPSTRSKVSLLLCDRTFCNLEAVAQRLVGGWSGYAIRVLAPFWSTDVAGDFLGACCSKVVANDSADTIISDAASLKSGIALWKEIHRGIATTKGIGWMTETPLQYRMADWENVCVNDSKYVAANSLIRAQAPVWPRDKHISVEEAFHFAACCKRIGKLAKQYRTGSGQGDDENGGIEFDDRVGAMPSQQPLLMEGWKVLACCDGLTGAPLGVSVKCGFDSTVAWLCSCLTFGGQRVLLLAQRRSEQQGSQDLSALQIVASDFDSRPPDYQRQENEGMLHPKPIPEVVDRLVFYMETGDETLAKLSHEFRFVLGMLQYIQARLSAAATAESALKSRSLQGGDRDAGCFLNLHCGHNNPFSRDEKQQLKVFLDQATSSTGTTMMASAQGQQVV